MIATHIEVNGRPRDIVAHGATTLLEVLHEQLGLMGAKRGCGYGICGACTVLIDGKPACACLALALNCDGRSIVTVEGISPNGNLHPIQQAILDTGVQCGFCITGIVLAAKSLLDEKPMASETEIRESLSGNMCRCTGYSSFVTAIKAVVEARHV